MEKVGGGGQRCSRFLVIVPGKTASVRQQVGFGAMEGCGERIANRAESLRVRILEAVTKIKLHFVFVQGLWYNVPYQVQGGF